PVVEVVERAVEERDVDAPRGGDEAQRLRGQRRRLIAARHDQRAARSYRRLRRPGALAWPGRAGRRRTGCETEASEDRNEVSAPMLSITAMSWCGFPQGMPE